MSETSSPSPVNETVLMIARVIVGSSVPLAWDFPACGCAGACGFALLALPSLASAPCFCAGAASLVPLSLPLAPHPDSSTIPAVASTAVTALIRPITQPLSRGYRPRTAHAGLGVAASDHCSETVTPAH